MNEYVTTLKNERKSRKRILLCVTGLSPQIVTETLYALCVRQAPAWVPDEVRLVTTQRGADNARLMLLSGQPGWFARLLRDWQLPSIQFDASYIEVLCDANGQPLHDIRDDADNQCAADGIAEVVRRLTQDESSEVHASIAGGRKTMGFFMGYAMSLWGRQQDRLSHVLVSSPFEGRAEFYYPTPTSHILAARTPGEDPLDASTAQVWLGDIPFVRLRGLLPAHLKAEHTGFAQAVTAANRALEDIELRIDTDRPLVHINRQTLRLPPMQHALLCLLAWRCRQQQPPLRAPNKLLPDDREWKDEVLHNLCSAMGQMDIPDSLNDKLQAQGPIAETFEQQLSKLQRNLRDSAALPLRQPIERVPLQAGSRQRGYRLALTPEQVQLRRSCPSKAGKLADQPDGQ